MSVQGCTLPYLHINPIFIACIIYQGSLSQFQVQYQIGEVKRIRNLLTIEEGENRSYFFDQERVDFYGTLRFSLFFPPLTSRDPIRSIPPHRIFLL